MKNLVKLLISAFLAANCHSILATSIEAGGTIYGNITWDADTVKIISDILVDNYATLTIEPGTRIEFKDLYNFNVEGRLLAEGEPGNEIIFTVDDTAGYHNFTHKGWNGITFDYTYIDSYSVDTSKLNHCIVEYAKSRGIKVAEFNKLVVSNCIIRHNKGGLAYASSKCLAVNNIVYGNLNAENGGAYNIFLAEETRIINNTLCNNKSVHGGSIYIEDYIWGPIIIKNTVSWGNSASVEGKEVYLKWLNTYYDYKPEFHYCNIEGGLESFHNLGIGFTSDMVVYNNNINEQPYFAAPENNNFELTDSSPCINLGDPSTVTTGFEEDVAGNPRIYDGETDRIDIGAYEYQGEPVNRPPYVIESEDQLTECNSILPMQVQFIDPDISDTHTILITTDTSDVSVINLSGDTSGSTYDVVPATDWTGTAIITVTVTDSYGNTDSDTYEVDVSDTFCGHITEDTTWDMDTIRITCDVVVEHDATLTINPGTVVEFQDFFHLDIEGTLLAVGEPGNPIVFTVEDTTGYHNYTHKGWNGLRFIFTGLSTNVDTSKVIHCVVEYVKFRGIGVVDFDKLIVANCIIRHNKGGLFFRESKCKALNNIVYNNMTGKYGGAYFLLDPGETRIINNTICNNRGEYGGSIYIEGYMTGPQLIKNTVSWGNTASVAGEEVYFNSIYSYSGYHPAFKYCNIEGGLSSFDNESGNFSVEMIEYINNIDSYPYFVDLENNDFDLTPSSPCINTGDPSTDISGFPEDFAGNPRIYNGNTDIIDIGAYEYHGEPVIFKTSDAGMIRIYPNPLNMSFNIEFKDIEPNNLIVEIRSIEGRLVLLKEIKSLSVNNAEIDVSAIPEGFYILRIKNDKILVTRKIEIIR